MVLSAAGWYEPLAQWAGCGATVPLLGFGHLLAKGVRTALAQQGPIRDPDRGAYRSLGRDDRLSGVRVVCSWLGSSHDQN